MGGLIGAETRGPTTWRASLGVGISRQIAFVGVQVDASVWPRCVTPRRRGSFKLRGLLTTYRDMQLATLGTKT